MTRDPAPNSVSRALVCAALLSGLSQRLLGAQLPIPCAPGGCGQSGPAFFVSSGQGTAVQSGASLTINQTSNKAVFNWASFDVSADGKVSFVQPSATSVALNRIFEANPSAIFGQVSANGQIYLVNANGFVFGPTARVNAAGLIVSSLGISDNVFNAGLLAPQLLASSSPALASTDNRTTVLDNAGNPILGADGKPLLVQINVQSGASLTTPSGRLLLAAPLIQNSGSLSAPDGQVVLAAGQQVFLQASSDPALRGLVVEVDGDGKAWNQLTGQIGAPRGNVSLVGLAVNQDGRISATTSVSASGSVRLEAGNNTTVKVGSTASTYTIAAQSGGTLELGPQSSIAVLPELASSDTAVPDQVQLLSQVNLVGQQILMHGGSITAPGGALNVTASANPDLGVVTDGNAAARIHVDSGTSIDLSGSVADLPVSANLLAIQLRANELADDPTQRSGPLRGQTVYVDARVGSPLISQSALQAAIGTVGQSVAQRTESGGTASFQSEGDVVIQAGATINVSGGHTTYEGGNFQTSELVGQNNSLTDVGTANPLALYTGVLNPTFTQAFNKWGVTDVVATPGLSHYESTYVQGAAAGKISIAAPALVLGGALVGSAVSGRLQRSAPAAGGQLVIGLPGGLLAANNSNQTDYLTPSVEFTAQPGIPVVVADDATLPPQTVQLPTQFLADGFTSTKIYSNGLITVPQSVPLNLSPGGTIALTAARVEVYSDITAPGGSVALQNTVTVGAGGPGISRTGVQLGDGVSIDVSGLWTNDFTAQLGAPIGTAGLFQNGGSITLGPLNGVIGGELSIGNGVTLRANGGAWLQSTGSVAGGTGGAIALQAGVLDTALRIGSGLTLSAFGVDGAGGGSLSLTAPRLLVTDLGTTSVPGEQVDDLATPAGPAPGGVFTVGVALFDRDGFSNVSLTANGPIPPSAPTPDVLTVQAGTVLTPRSESLTLKTGFQSKPSSAAIGGFTQVTTLPLGSRAPTDVTLSVAPQANDASLTIVGRLDLQKGASIIADPGTSSISLSSAGGTYVDGVLRASGGTISLQTPGPSNSPDPGYLPALAIELGPEAVLDAGGSFIPTPNNQGLQLGTVLAGGQISLTAQRGSVITDAGSQILIDGTSAPLDVASGLSGSSYRRFTVPSAAGALVLSAPESISLLGSFSAHAGAGNYGNPAGGSLEVDLTRSENFATSADLLPEFPTTPRVIELDSNLPANARPSDPASGRAVLGVSELTAAGIDSLTLDAGDEILFGNTVPLSLARQVILHAPAIGVAPGVTAVVNGNYAELGYQLPAAGGAVPAAGTGILEINAQQIDLLGSFTLQNVAATDLTSGGDILLRDTFSGTAKFGSLALDGDLVLDAARLYPATDSSFTIATVHGMADPATTVNYLYLMQSAVSPGTPLTAGGSISLSADTIVSSGTLLAPFGSLALNASDALIFQAGSVTSVSGAGATIPFGSTQLGGQTWQYAAGSGQLATITGIPARAISLSAPTIDVASGATVNLAGGGELYAYEWVPGTGGTKDALGQNTTTGLAVTPGLYAVLPSMIGQFAPYDPQETPTSGLTPGMSLYLSGGGALAAGVYPLLPARDALVPGAFLIQVQVGFANILPGDHGSLPNGTPVVAGYTTFGTTGLHAGGYQGVAVWPGSYTQSLAQYQITNASTYFAAQASAAAAPSPDLPADAGSLSIDVSKSLGFLGSVLGNAGTGGVAAKIDLSAPVLTVTSPGAVVPEDGVTLTSDVIASWKAGELVLGGHPAADGSIDVLSDIVNIDDNAHVAADQVILVANQAIDLRPGATLLSTSASPGGHAPIALPAPSILELSGTNAAGAAFLAVSDLSLPVLQRAGSAASAATISIQTGANIESLGALSVDAVGGVKLAGNLSGSGANWSLAASSIGFVGTGSSADALQITAAQLSEMQAAGAISLVSQGNINLYSPVQLGASSATAVPTLNALTLSAAGLIDNGGASGAVFGAKTLTLQGVGGTPTTPLPAAGDSLTFTAGELDFGTGVLPVSGFRDTTIEASGGVVGRQAGGLITGGNLTLTAPLLTAVAGGQTSLSAPNGALTLGSPASGAALPTIANDLGGELDLAANSITLSGNLMVPAGIVSAHSTQGLTLGTSGVIDVGGRTVNIAGRTLGSEGGAVTLSAGAGLNLASGSVINVSGSGDAPAGSISLTAGGAANILATLSGAAAGAAGGSFSLDAGSLTAGLAPLAAALQSGGFSAADSIRAHTGDLTLPAGAQLSANQITLVADGGILDIGGTLSAAQADLRGTIGLFGGEAVMLDPAAVVRANASRTDGMGGQIEVGTAPGGAVTFGSGSVLSAAGSAADGTLLIRAPIAGGDVAVVNAGADLSAFGQIFVEPVFTQPIGATLSAANLTTIENSVNTIMATLAPSVLARLNPGGVLPLSVRAAVDLEATNSLTLSNSLNFLSWRPGGQPVDLTFRTPGALTIGATAANGTPIAVALSDGFTATAKTKAQPTPLLVLSPSASSSMRFVAGADTESPDPLAVVSGSGANLTLKPGSVVRTGTGEIDLIAAGAVDFLTPTSGSAASVFTAGINPNGPGGAPVAGIAVPNSSLIFNFPTQGGAVRIAAGGDILGAAVAQSVTAWQIREGNGTTLPTQWGADLDQFGWNVGALGGGDVQVNASGSILNLSAAAADSYYNPSLMGTGLYTPSGGLSVNAGGDVGSSQFFLAQGTGTLRAGGAFSAVQPLNATSQDTVGSLLALGDAQLSVRARTGIVIDAIINPTTITQVAIDRTNTLGSYFFTYGPDSSVQLQTSAGNVSLVSTDSHEEALMGSTGASGIAVDGQIYPGTLIARSLLQDVMLNSATLFPTDAGQLQVMAGRDVIGLGSVLVSDAGAATVATPAAPFLSYDNVSVATKVDFQSGRHASDATPALVAAGRDISDLVLSVPKATDVIAGRDITDMQFFNQNLNAGDLTLISAGRDISDQPLGSTIQTAGPGQLDLLAGRNVDLGFSHGVQTVGNTVNPNLPTAAGADLTVMAGLGAAPDFSGFVSQIIAPDPVNQGLLISYVQSLTGEKSPNFTAAVAEFAQFSADQQRPLIDQVFFDQLSLSGIQANTTPKLGFSTGYAAIDALFPQSRTAVNAGVSPYQGNISLTFSRIYTTNGGGIALIAPGGNIDVGLANPPAALASTRLPSQLGIVAQGPGDVDIYTKGDVNVNASRIFTLGGGNILIWSDEGSIDAGRGSKSSISAPPPEVLVDSSGNVSLSFSGAVAGSGIRTIQIDPTVNPGNVDLVAPQGTVNAGDAGIGAAGNINIAALHVVGLDNIQFGGNATGVPATVSNLGASLSGVSNTASSATNSSTSAAAAGGEKESAAAAPLAQTALSWLDVFVTGLGDENCKPDDAECLKRQKTGAR